MIRTSFFCLLICSAIASQLPAQETSAKAFVLPSNPQAWINSPPIATESMRGKAIVLYFFEEDCPRCREKWPAIMQAVKQNQSSPVVLIGVNSGSSPEKTRSYVKQNRISIPVIMDPDRSLEKKAGVPEISLKNILQARMIDPDGELKAVNGFDISSALQTAAAQASWNVDPAGFPPKVMATWRQIEFGNYTAAAKMMKRFSSDRSPEVKAAAASLNSYIDDKISTIVADAEASASADENWKAYRLYDQIKMQFVGCNYPESVTTEWTRLKKDESVRTEALAMKQWQTIQKTMASGRLTPARLAIMLQKLIDKYPGTEAAESAQQKLGG